MVMLLKNAEKTDMHINSVLSDITNGIKDHLDRKANFLYYKL